MFNFSNALLVEFRDLFFNELDRYVQQSKKGSYFVAGHYKDVNGRRTLVKPEPLRLQAIDQHLSGEVVLGTYTTS